ncbi:MAG: hypothetical protein Q4E68_11925 [Prevotellaceae bacterium]|nr:hypothetical protein [Prevotellaceae bacterium]
MKKKEYKTPRSKVILLNFRNTFLGNSVGGSEEGKDEDAEAKRTFGRFASWDEDDEY